MLNAIPGVTHVDDVVLEIESELSVYQGHVNWTQVFERDGSTSAVRAQMRIEPHLPASPFVAQARSELDKYFRSGQARHQKQAERRSHVVMILSAVPGVISVESVRVDEGKGSGALCGNAPVCAHSLIVPGKHRITTNGSRTGDHTRAIQPPC